MKKARWFTLVLSIVFILTFVSGCSSSNGKGATEKNAPEKSTAGESKSSKSQVKQISIASAGTSGTFYIVASGFADLINKKLGINSIAEVTAGSVENAKLLDNKKVEMGVLQVDVAQSALEGKGQFKSPVALSAVVPMYPNVVQIITLKNSKIEKVSDLKGKKISVGSPGSGILATNEIILKTLGLSMSDIQPEYLSFAETTTAFRDGSIDAAIVNTAAPAPFVVDLETTHPVKLIPLSDEEINKFNAEFPYYVKATIPKESYKSLDADVPTFAVWITLAAQSDLPEDVVYDVVKTIFENQKSLEDVHVVSKYITLDNVKNISGVPYHPGAVKYYKEKGISIEGK